MELNVDCNAELSMYEVLENVQKSSWVPGGLVERCWRFTSPQALWCSASQHPCYRAVALDADKQF